MVLAPQPVSVVTSHVEVTSVDLGIAEGVVYSYPVICADGLYEIVQGLDIDEFSRAKMDATDTELREQRENVAELL